MKKLKVLGLALLIFILTTTAVFAANESRSATASAQTVEITQTVTGQGQDGKITISSSGGGGAAYWTKYCKAADTSYSFPVKYLPADGGVLTFTQFMHTGCTYQLVVYGGTYFSTLGTIKNYQ